MDTLHNYDEEMKRVNESPLSQFINPPDIQNNPTVKALQYLNFVNRNAKDKSSIG